MFNAKDADSLVEYDGAIDVVFEPKVESWQGRTSVKLHVRDVLMRTEEVPGSCDAATARMVDDLFARSEEFTGFSELADISQAPSFHTKVVGVTFDGRQEGLVGLEQGEELLLVREPDNPHDPNAIAVLRAGGVRIGYLKRLIAAAIAPEIDRGANYGAVVSGLTGGTAEKASRGVNILVMRQGRPGSADALAVAERRHAERERLASLPVERLTDELRALLIGDASLLPAQAQALDNLDRGVSTLCVMATGRGKSLIFHVHAARTALLRHRASVFVYPLRALVADQAFHLGQVFDHLGMATRVLTGETPLEQRDAIFSDLADGTVDIVLTTPEFLAIHSRQFAEGGRVGFVVVDEAHHAGFARGGNRSAYLEMPRVLEELGHPVVLGVTATASTLVAEEVRRLLGIEGRGMVVDSSSRDNLLVCDERNTAGRDDRLVSLLARGEKTLAYVNSREQTVSLARMLRHRVWECGHRVAFYNGGLFARRPRGRGGGVQVGRAHVRHIDERVRRGVNLPDVRHVVLYHLPFDEVEFNQMSGRAGRDGDPAWVHLAYGVADARINERILARDAPPRDDLATLYRVLMGRSRAARLAGGARLRRDQRRPGGRLHRVQRALRDRRPRGILRYLHLPRAGLREDHGVRDRAAHRDGLLSRAHGPDPVDPLPRGAPGSGGVRALQGLGPGRARRREVRERISRPIVPETSGEADDER